MKTRTRHVYVEKHPIVVGGAIVALLGLGGYLLYKSEHPALAASTPAAPSGGGGTTPSTPSGNPTVDTGDQNVSTADAASGSDSADPGAVYTNG